MKLRYIFVLASALLMSGCLKDRSLRTFTLYRPVYSLKPEIKENARLQKPETLKNQGSFAVYNNMMFINERGRGIHVVDYSAPSSPVNKGFIPIPGNTGVAIRNGLLYADCYSFLLVLRIHASDNIVFEREINDAFLSRVPFGAADTNAIQVTWVKKDTTVSEEYYNSHYKNYQMESGALLANSGTPVPGGGGSTGSSMAVFAVVNDFLYTVDNTMLRAFSLADGLNPSLCSEQAVPGGNVETIFPFGNNLFIGSMTGMSIFSLANTCSPAYLSQFQHVRVCDPVIADNKHAFVTLRSGGGCGGAVNRLDVLDIADVSKPVLLSSYQFTNPHGLSKDGNVLFLCDGFAGLKVLDATDAEAITVKQTLPGGTAIDVVALNNLALVTFNDAIRLYSYDQMFNVSLVGSISKN